MPMNKIKRFNINMLNIILPLIIFISLGKPIYNYIKYDFLVPEPEIDSRIFEQLPLDMINFNDLTLNHSISLNLFIDQVLAKRKFIRVGPYVFPVKSEVNLLIESGGGDIGAVLALIQGLGRTGMTFNCYIVRAYSAAFTFVQGLCHKRILLEGGLLMTHKATNTLGIDLYLTKISDQKLCRVEANRVYPQGGVEWCRKSRLDYDKYYTDKESLKMNLVDRIYKYKK